MAQCNCGRDDEVEYYGPLRGALDVISGKYTMETIRVIGTHEPARFATIEDHLPEASSSTISDRLSELEDAGFILRTQYEEIPPRVEYELTGKGRAFERSVEPLLEWAREYEENE